MPLTSAQQAEGSRVTSGGLILSLAPALPANSHVWDIQNPGIPKGTLHLYFVKQILFYSQTLQEVLGNSVS